MHMITDIVVPLLGTCTCTCVPVFLTVAVIVPPHCGFRFWQCQWLFYQPIVRYVCKLMKHAQHLANHMQDSYKNYMSGTLHTTSVLQQCGMNNTE